MPIGMITLGPVSKPWFKPGLIKPGFISHENSDLNQGINHTKTRFDQVRFKPWFYPLKLRNSLKLKLGVLT